MSPRLISLELLPNPNGLAMPARAFGEFLTLVHGPNGAGKTVVMCSLFWALGGPRRVEGAAWSRCWGVRLVMGAADGRIAIIQRAFSAALEATIEINGTVREFDVEGGFSAAILELLGIPRREWTAKGGGTVSVYTSVLTPAFAIDQDKGWTMPYAPFDARVFVEDQAEEVARLLFGLEPKHDVERDRMRKRLERDHDRTTREVEARSRTLESLRQSATKADARDVAELRAAREQLEQELRSFDGLVTAFAEANEGLHARLQETRAQRDAVDLRLRKAKRHRDTLKRLTQEVEGDLGVVGSNEIAAHALRRFCGNSNCQFFVGRDIAASYGRRVLYLRDQLKDVAAAMESAQGEIAKLEKRRDAAVVELALLREEYEKLASSSASERVSSLVNTLAKDLARVSTGIALAEEIEAEQRERDHLARDRDRLLDDLRNHDAVRKQRDATVGAVRKSFEEILTSWLTSLGTNDHGTVTIDTSFRVALGGEHLRDDRGPSGSSRTRFILAFHAARLEAALVGGGPHPGLLLLDAPKQHELKDEDFDAYLERLRGLSERFPGRVQVVLSLSSDLSLRTGDVRWDPEFQLDDVDAHGWFLRPAVTAT